MAEWRKIQTKFWQDSEILDLTPEDKLFYLYLLTNPHTTACGCYELSPKIAATELGYSIDIINQLLQEFAERGKIRYDTKTKEVLIVNWLKYNSVSSPTVKKLLKKELASIKSPEFLECLAKNLDEKADTGRPEYSSDSVPIVYGGDVDVDVDVEKSNPCNAKALAPDPPNGEVKTQKRKSSSNRPTYPEAAYEQVVKAYRTYKGLRLQGTELSPVRREIRLMFDAGHSPEAICEFMRALSRSGEKWTEGWTIWTVRKKMPEWRSGVLNLGPKQGAEDRWALRDRWIRRKAEGASEEELAEIEKQARELDDGHTRT